MSTRRDQASEGRTTATPPRAAGLLAGGSGQPLGAAPDRALTVADVLRLQRIAGNGAAGGAPVHAGSGEVILRVQRSAGNRAVGRLLGRAPYDAKLAKSANEAQPPVASAKSPPDVTRMSRVGLFDVGSRAVGGVLARDRTKTAPLPDWDPRGPVEATKPSKIRSWDVQVTPGAGKGKRSKAHGAWQLQAGDTVTIRATFAKGARPTGQLTGLPGGPIEGNWDGTDAMKWAFKTDRGGSIHASIYLSGGGVNEFHDEDFEVHAPAATPDNAPASKPAPAATTDAESAKSIIDAQLGTWYHSTRDGIRSADLTQGPDHSTRWFLVTLGGNLVWAFAPFVSGGFRALEATMSIAGAVTGSGTPAWATELLKTKAPAEKFKDKIVDEVSAQYVRMQNDIALTGEIKALFKAKGLSDRDDDELAHKRREACWHHMFKGSVPFQNPKAIEDLARDNVEKIWAKFRPLAEDYDDDDEAAGAPKTWYGDRARYMQAAYYTAMVTSGVINQIPGVKVTNWIEPEYRGGRWAFDIGYKGYQLPGGAEIDVLDKISSGAPFEKRGSHDAAGWVPFYRTYQNLGKGRPPSSPKRQQGTAREWTKVGPPGFERWELR